MYLGHNMRPYMTYLPCKQAHVLLHVLIFHDGVQIVCVTKLGPKEKSSYFLPSGECIIYVNWISIIIPSTINSSKSRTDQLSKENARSVHVWRLEIQILARLVQWSSTNFCRWSYFSCLNLRDYSHNDFFNLQEFGKQPRGLRFLRTTSGTWWVHQIRC